MTDGAQTGDIERALRDVLPALDRHLQAPANHADFRPEAPWRGLLDTPLPAEGAGAEATLRCLAETVIPNAMRMTAPGFLGWITTGATLVPAVTRFVTTLAGTQRYMGHSGNLLESVGLRWLAESCQLSAGMQGVFSSSGSVANLLAIGAARQHAYERLGHDPARHGMATLPRGRIYGSAEMHHCMLKSAGVLGLGRDAVELVPVDRSQRVDVSAMAAAIEQDVAAGVVPVAVIGVAGTTNTGAIDDLSALADLAQQHGVWFHVDGAYGLFGRLDQRVAHRYVAVERADSVVVDAHKWLCVPTGIGATFVRDSAVLGRAFTGEPSDYFEAAFHPVAQRSPWESMGAPYHDWSLDLSAPARGMVVWAALHELGTNGLRERIVRDNTYARSLADLVRVNAALELLVEPELSICCFRYRRDGLDETAHDELNQELVRRLHAETPYVPSATRVNGHFAIRPCFINPRTEESDVVGLVEAVCRIGDTV